MIEDEEREVKGANEAVIVETDVTTIVMGGAEATEETAVGVGSKKGPGV